MTNTLSLDSFTTFGALLKYLRQRQRLTQREFGLAVGYGDALSDGNLAYHRCRMTNSQLHELIAGGEDSFTEFKRDITQRSDFAGEMIAFANTAGGQILVGVDDNGVIVGVADPHQIEEAIVSIARHNCVPALNPLFDHIAVDNTTVSVIQIARREGPPAENNSGQCYIRVGSTKRLASPQERARLLQSAGLVHFDETPVLGTTWDDIEIAAFERYYDRVFESALAQADMPVPKMLENMRFMVSDVRGQQCLSLAGLLLFGKRPQDYRYFARISAVRWAGTEAAEEIIDRKEIVGRLTEQIDEAESFVLRNTRLTTRIDKAQQTDNWEYPRVAVREALVNAVAHRDYSLDGAQILLYVFDDRIELRSPGALPNSVTVDNIRTHYSKPRNETIARALHNLGYVNTLGSGVPRMIRLIRASAGRDAEFEATSSQFLVRLWARH